MGGDSSCFPTLLSFLETAIERFPDMRTGANKRYSMRDGVLSGFSVFFTQSPSFLNYQVSMHKSKGDSNARTVFTIEKIPSDNQIRTLLDPVSPTLIFPAFSSAFSFLQEQNIVESYRSFNDNLLIGMDGTWFHSSEKIHCDKCLYKNHRDGRTTYYHSAITPVIVKPGNDKVISLEPEFIQPQDGYKKQDCESVAGRRWLSTYGLHYAPLGVTILGDDLYCKQPICELLLLEGYNFILTCKPSSHKYLAEWISFADPKQDLNELIIKRWTGKERLFYRYRFANGVPLKEGKDALLVNWAELTILDKDGNIRKRFSFATNHSITRDNIVELIEAGRARWKIENEHNNTLKTKGYNLEHNFGHGKENLANLLLTLNLYAFLFHTVLEFFDKRYGLIRKTLPSRKTFFDDIRALTRYLLHNSWDDLMCFMLRGLELEDPGG